LRRLYEASVLDPLTGAAHRAYVDTRLAEEISFSRRHGSSLSVLRLDIDHFKSLNDRYGDPVGDQVLAVLAAGVSSQLRQEDVLGRYGGDEFLAILRRMDLNQAREVADRIRRVVESACIEHDGETIRVTVSLGCASGRCCEPLVARELVEIAVKRLRSAKLLGGNRVDCGEQAETTVDG
jgi:diguanylate cyclase (GGDEF)-like protein